MPAFTSDTLLESRWARVVELRMHALVGRRGNDGAPVVFVHGLGVSSRYMIPTIRLLAADYAVYAPDLPGHGRSEKPLRARTIPELADALMWWMDAEGLAR